VTSTVIIQAKRGIGDVIWHLPFIRAIAAATPEQRVTFLTPPSSLGAELLQAETCVARTLYFEHGGGELARGVQIYRLVRMLRSLQPQTVWILDKTIRPALAAWLAGVPRRIGMGLGRQRLLVTNKGLGPAYADEWPNECLTALLHDLQIPLETTEPELRLPPAIAAAVGKRFGGRLRPWLTIALGASSPERDWTSAQWTTFLGTIRQGAKGTIFLVGGPSNASRAAALIRATSGVETINACDLPLVESAALMQHADLFAGPDSGPMNVAAAVGTTAIGFFATKRVLTYSKHIRAILPDNGRIGPDGMQRLSPIRAADEVLVEFNRTSAPSLAPRGSSSAQT
jgi:heptosyltransferase II